MSGLGCHEIQKLIQNKILGAALLKFPEVDVDHTPSTDQIQVHTLSSAAECQHSSLEIDGNSCEAQRCWTHQSIEIPARIAAVVDDKCGLLAKFSFAQFDAVQPHLFQFDIAFEIG